MKLQLLIIIVISAFLTASCSEDIEIAKGYPTTIEEASTIELNKILGQVEQTPMVNCVAVNNFGFLFFDYESDSCFDIDNWKNDSIENIIITRAEEAFTKYPHFFNFPEGSNPVINSITTENGIKYDDFYADYPDSLPPVWVATTKLQKYEDYEVRGTNLQVLLSPDEIIGISGHWYSDISIPGSDNFDEDGAKGLLLDKTFEHNRNTILIQNNTNWHKSKKIIVPIVRSEQIELHVCWALYPGTWEILVDSQTGDVLSSIKI
ncbi:MAG: hypothetical protein K9G70_06210 [Prolixibacteraceae bacterium]|nr:hypothetical protein [Prolixibacteraceae bacterium]